MCESCQKSRPRFSIDFSAVALCLALGVVGFGITQCSTQMAVEQEKTKQLEIQLKMQATQPGSK